MAHIFVDDGFPEAGEYASNYVWFDPADPKSVSRAYDRAATLKAARETYGRWAGLRRWFDFL